MRWLHVVVVVLATAYATARTAQRTSAVSPKITSLNDKEVKRKAMEHAAFANAGKRAGVEIWRIEDFNPVAVPQSDFGKFYKGDSYIVLKTNSNKRNELSWDIHYWLGSATTQDEAGAAAILSVGLDDKFNGAPVQHREVEGHESAQFLSYFSPAIRYMDGGHASGFSHVTTNAGAEKRLFQIKGKRNVRVRQVEPLISSMNKGDVFILDKDQDILVYVGEKSKNVEKLKAISVANQIRDQDHHGRGKVEIIDQYSSEGDVQKFFTALGSGSRELVPEESAGGDDQTFERSEESTPILSEVSDSSGKLKITPLSKPFTQEQLKPQEAYILDTVSGSIYVWVGKQATEREKSEAMNKAQEYLRVKKYPAWVHVARIPQGTEPASFKQYFSTWRDVGMSHSRLVRSASDEELFSSDKEVAERRARIIGRSGTARDFAPDNGNGHFVVYRQKMNDFEKIYTSSERHSTPGQQYGVFYQGESYLVEYTYTGSGGEHSTVVYYWLGKESPLEIQKAAAGSAFKIDKKNQGQSIIVRVPQGEEPKHFLKMFSGRFATLFGGEQNEFKKTNAMNSFDTDGVRLFRMHGTESADMRLNQVPEATSSLHADDVFLLQTPRITYIWVGKDSTFEEREEGVRTVMSSDVGGDRDVVKCNQGEEPAEFWKYLSSTGTTAPSSWRDVVHRRISARPRLYQVTKYEAGREDYEEMASLNQMGLYEDEVSLVDLGDVLYAWIGRLADKAQRSAVPAIVDRFLQQHTQNKPVIVIKQGFEPVQFTQLFTDWHPDNWRKYKEDHYEIVKQEALQFNEVD